MKSMFCPRLFPLLLLDYDRPLDIQIVFLLQNVKKGRVSSAINSDLLELVAEVILDGLLRELVFFVQDVIFAFKDETVDDEVFFLEQI